MRNLYRGPSIDASYQVSVHLVKGFQGHICLYTGYISIGLCLYNGYIFIGLCLYNGYISIGLSVIQFTYLYRDNCILNTNIYI
jgi:hypothetical protein